ncbi:MAG: hypothetical protein AB7T48_00980 [Solirubrobacterales bacterium]
MPPQTKTTARRPVLTALCLAAICLLVGVVSAATAKAAPAGQFKAVFCAGNVGSNGFGTGTNTISPQNPGGIFDFPNSCGPAPDPAGNAAFLRIAENQPSGNAGNGAYGFVHWDTPPFVHFKTAGGWTRQPLAFNDGWRARFWGIDFDNNGFQIFSQGVGAPAGTTSTFAPHLWPGGNADFWRFAFEVNCVRPAGCDRTNFNAADVNTLVFTLSDDQNAQVGFTNGSTLMSGAWAKGSQAVTFNHADNGSGLRFTYVRVDGVERFRWDHRAQCNLDASQANGEYARVFQPCPVGGPWPVSAALDTGTLSDGAHTLQACAQDYGQAIGLNGTASESCVQSPIYSDNTAPGAPTGLVVTSSNPNRYLDRFGAQFTLPPNQGSPITKVHYQVINAAGEVVKPEQILTATNPTGLTGIEGPTKAGDYRLRVWLEDQVGFTGPAAITPIPHDTTPPAAPQLLAVTSPNTPRAVDGFDLRWQNIVDPGAPIDAALYSILDGAGKVVVPATRVAGENIQAIGDLDAPGLAGAYQLRLWLSDGEGNVGAPVTAPLAYDCQRSAERGATLINAKLGGGAGQTVQQGDGTSLTGSLRSPTGAVASSPVCIFTRVQTDSGREFLGMALTDAGGDFRFPIPAGPSREVIAIHRDGTRQLRASASLDTVVQPTLKARKTTVRNGESAYFEGQIPGPHNDNVTIVLQVKSGQGWLAFRRYRTRNDGHFEMVYPFRRTTRPTSYEMRAQVREAGGYPYLEGDSDPVILRVLPEAKPKKQAAKKRCGKVKKKSAGRRGAKGCPKKHRGKKRSTARR